MECFLYLLVGKFRGYLCFGPENELVAEAIIVDSALGSGIATEYFVSIH